MKEIEKYIDIIYKDFDKSEEEVKILIEETKIHLLDEIEDLKKSGLSEEESIKRAISNFGAGKLVRDEFNLILKKQNKFMLILKRVAVITLVFACISFFISTINEIKKNSNPYIVDHNTINYIIDTIQNNLKEKDELDSNLKNQLNALLNDFNERTENGVYSFSIKRENKDNESYKYKREVNNDNIKNENMGIKSNKEGWVLEYKFTDKQSQYDNKVLSEIWNKEVNSLSNRVGQLSIFLFGVTGALFIILIFYKVYLKS